MEDGKTKPPQAEIQRHFLCCDFYLSPLLLQVLVIDLVTQQSNMLKRNLKNHNSTNMPVFPVQQPVTFLCTWAQKKNLKLACQMGNCSPGFLNVT